MDFIQAVERRGVGAMELVAMDMKLRGTYIARQLSFHGVQFKVETVPIDTKFRSIYNDSVNLVSRLHQICVLCGMVLVLFLIRHGMRFAHVCDGVSVGGGEGEVRARP